MLLSKQNQNAWKVSFSWFMGQLCESITSIALAPWENSKSISLPTQKSCRLTVCVRKLPPLHYSRVIVRMMQLLFRKHWWQLMAFGRRWLCLHFPPAFHFLFFLTHTTDASALRGGAYNCKRGTWHALPVFPPSLYILSEHGSDKHFAQHRLSHRLCRDIVWPV